MDAATIKNKIRLHIRKSRQKAIKNVKRDIAKYNDDSKKSLLIDLKKAKIDKILNNILTKNENSLSSSNGEKKIAEIFKKSKEKVLVSDLENAMKNFRQNKDSKALKSENHKIQSNPKQAKLETSVDEKSESDSDFSDDSFFESEDEKPKKQRKKTSVTEPSVVLEDGLNLAPITQSRYSVSKKQQYELKKQAILEQKQQIKTASKAHERNHKHLLTGNLHPSWQAKLAQKKKLSSSISFQGKKIKFDSDSE